MQGTDGNFYGIVQFGLLFYGGIYRVSQSGTATLLYSFTNGSDGASPRGLWCKPPMETSMAQPIPAGQWLCTVFGMSPTGTVHTLHSFDNTDGANPPQG